MRPFFGVSFLSHLIEGEGRYVGELAAEQRNSERCHHADVSDKHSRGLETLQEDQIGGRQERRRRQLFLYFNLRALTERREKYQRRRMESKVCVFPRQESGSLALAVGRNHLQHCSS